MTTPKHTDAVRDHYTRIASGSQSCCSTPSCCSSDTSGSLPAYVTQSMNEPYRNVDPHVLEVADLGLGCGTPVEHAGLRPGMTVLDLGAGAGIDVFLAARIVGPEGHVIGLDMTDAMLERAEANRRHLNVSNAEFRKGEIEQMPVDSGSVDRVISNCVINLVADKRRAFSEIQRVLRPGGEFTVSDIVYTGRMPAEVRSDPEMVACCIGGALERDEYLQLIHSAGFEDLSIVSERHYPVAAGQPYGLLSVTVKGVKR